MQHVEPVQDVFPASHDRALLGELLATGITITPILLSSCNRRFDGRWGGEVGSTALRQKVDEGRRHILGGEVSRLMLGCDQDNACDARRPCIPLIGH